MLTIRFLCDGDCSDNTIYAQGVANISETCVNCLYYLPEGGTRDYDACFNNTVNNQTCSGDALALAPFKYCLYFSDDKVCSQVFKDLDSSCADCVGMELWYNTWNYGKVVESCAVSPIGGVCSTEDLLSLSQDLAYCNESYSFEKYNCIL